MRALWFCRLATDSFTRVNDRVGPLKMKKKGGDERLRHSHRYRVSWERWNFPNPAGRSADFELTW